MIKKYKLENALVVGTVILVLNALPALFGYFFHELFLVVPLIGLIVTSVFIFRCPVAPVKSNRILFGLIFSLILWLVLQALIINNNIYIGLSLLGSLPVYILAYTLFFRNKTELVLKTIVIVMVILSCSQFVSYSLEFLGFDPLIVALPTTEEYGFRLLKWKFPFTLTFHMISIQGFHIDRSTGIFREPGLYQLFINTSYFALDFIRIKHKKALRFLLLFSLLMTFSTAGYIIFTGCMVYKIIVAQRGKIIQRFFLLLIIIAFGWVSVTYPYFGLSDKISRNSTRMEGYKDSWELLMNKPLIGYGMASRISSSYGGRLGGTLPNSLHRLGFVGLFLYLSILFYAVWKHYSMKTLVLFLPFFATFMFAQPMMLKAFTFLMLFLPTRHLSDRYIIARQRSPIKFPELVSSEYIVPAETQKV